MLFGFNDAIFQSRVFQKDVIQDTLFQKHMFRNFGPRFFLLEDVAFFFWWDPWFAESRF